MMSAYREMQVFVNKQVFQLEFAVQYHKHKPLTTCLSL